MKQSTKALESAEQALIELKKCNNYEQEIIDDYIGDFITKEEAEKRLDAL